MPQTNVTGMVTVDRQTCLMASSFPGQPGQPTRDRINQSDFNETRDDGVAVASAGPYANHFHLAPDRYRGNHATTSSLYILQATCSS